MRMGKRDGSSKDDGGKGRNKKRENRERHFENWKGRKRWSTEECTLNYIMYIYQQTTTNNPKRSAIIIIYIKHILTNF